MNTMNQTNNNLLRLYYMPSTLLITLYINISYNLSVLNNVGTIIIRLEKLSHIT